MHHNFYTIFSDKPTASPHPTQSSSERSGSNEQQPKRARQISGASQRSDSDTGPYSRSRQMRPSRATSVSTMATVDDLGEITVTPRGSPSPLQMWPSERGEFRVFNSLTGQWLEKRNPSTSDIETPPDSETESSSYQGSNTPTSQVDALLRKTVERAGLSYEDVVAASSPTMDTSKKGKDRARLTPRTPQGRPSSPHLTPPRHNALPRRSPPSHIIRSSSPILISPIPLSFAGSPLAQPQATSTPHRSSLISGPVREGSPLCSPSPAITPTAASTIGSGYLQSLPSRLGSTLSPLPRPRQASSPFITRPTSSTSVDFSASDTLQIEPDANALSEDPDTTIRIASGSIKGFINSLLYLSSPPSAHVDSHDPDDFFSSGPRPPSEVPQQETLQLPSRDLTGFIPPSPPGSLYLPPDGRQNPPRVYGRTPHDPDAYYSSGLRPSAQSANKDPDRIVWSNEAGYDGGGEDADGDKETEEDVFYDAIDGQDHQEVGRRGVVAADVMNQEPATKGDIVCLHDNMKTMFKTGFEEVQASMQPGSSAVPQKRTISGNDSRARSDKDKAIAAMVRSEFEELFSKSGDKIFGPSPTAEEKSKFLQLWETSKGGCHARPIEQFCIDVRDTPHSPWNKSMSNVFANHAIQKYGYPSDPGVRGQILHAFFVRVKGLHANWTGSIIKHPTETAEEKARSRSYQRKKADHDRHKEIATKYPTLQKFVGVVDALGIAGMSSDESDSSEGQKRYVITQPAWRSAEIRKRDTRGQHVRHRAQSERVSQWTLAPLQLPINFYDATWLQDQSVLWKKEVLQPHPEMDFNGGNEVLNLINTLAVQGDSIRKAEQSRKSRAASQLKAAAQSKAASQSSEPL
ncbi:hypothetical protein EVG20_g8546 [Dentipellis fragilis]|uniref:Uncharacterized protein n=1 Tax=Dentipellis fragilis TaxID=205917 RepID=A0A4Y9Y9C9_9AGAM|nr:hypothetical protein EVG20_g8546 [Dentipellis fragilis]